VAELIPLRLCWLNIVEALAVISITHHGVISVDTWVVICLFSFARTKQEQEIASGGYALAVPIL
jgi:hypothetical protein